MAEYLVMWEIDWTRVPVTAHPIEQCDPLDLPSASLMECDSILIET